MSPVDLEPYFASPYATPTPVKHAALLETLRALTLHHMAACPPYGRIVERLHGGAGAVRAATGLSALPALPVGLFKALELRSIATEDVFRVLTSSGTTSQIPSRVVLDRHTAALQRRALVGLMSDWLGRARRPMLIVDARETVRTGSARAAGIAGMMNLGRAHHFALDASMALDLDALERWLARHDGAPLLVFGFTFLIWQALVERLAATGRTLQLPPDSVVVTSGGWKKLADRAVSPAVFRARLGEVLGVARVHDFYGLVEQVGAVYVACEHGWFHASGFGDVLLRDVGDPDRLSTAPGAQGLLQTVSVLPWSYPGHSLLTEDLATIAGVDDCPCGRLGTRFRVHGRLPRAELRGCSDTVQEVRR